MRKPNIEFLKRVKKKELFTQESTDIIAMVMIRL